MGICPTLKQLMLLELELFTKTQVEMPLPEDNFKRQEAEWNKVFDRTKALGGKDLILLEEPEDQP